MPSAYCLFQKAHHKYQGNFLARTLRYIDPHIDLRVYVLQSFEDDLNYYTVSVETNGGGFVLAFEYQPDEPTPHLAERLQTLEVPSGYYLIYVDGHTNQFLLLHHKSRTEAKATYARLYQRYFRNQIFMKIIKV